MNEFPIPLDKEIEPKHREMLNFLKREGFVYPWRKLIIGIDGVDGVGKSTVAAFLSWQLGMPFASLDEYMIKGEPGELTYREADLLAFIRSRLDDDRPVIVEGILLLSALEKVGLNADILIRVVMVTKDGTCKGMSTTPGGAFEKLYKDYLEYFEHIQPNYVFINSETDMFFGQN